MFSRRSTDSPFVCSGLTRHLAGEGLVEWIRRLHAHGAGLRIRVRGMSMTPAIEDRDIVTISPLLDGHPVTGDLLAFRSPIDGLLRIHRAIAKQSGGWLLKGDNCQTDDGIIPGSAILGLVTHIEKAGRLRRTLRRILRRFNPE